MTKSEHFLNELTTSRVAVLGLGVTGLSVVRYLTRHQIQPDVFDSRASFKLDEENSSLLSPLNVHFGDFDEQALEAYDYVIVSPGLDLRNLAIASNPKFSGKLFCDVELFARVNDKPVLAVTGSNGKSTVVAWLEDFLNRIGQNAVACGNYGVPVLDVVEQDFEVYVLELSSFQLETICSLQCKAATVLNVTEDHMDRYASFNDYSLAKNRIYQNAQLCLANAEDNQTLPLKQNATCTSFGMTNSAEWRFDRVTGDLLHSSEKVADFNQFKIKGEHNGLNALAVMALASSLNIELSKYLTELAQFTGLPHRCETVAEESGISYIDDSKATNVASTQAALKGLGGDKNVILIAGGDAKGAELSELKSDVLRHCKHVFALGKDKQAFAQMLGTDHCTLVDSLQHAVEHAMSIAKSGDLVLLSPACASIDMFKNYQQRGAMFKQAVLDKLSEGHS